MSLQKGREERDDLQCKTSVKDSLVFGGIKGIDRPSKAEEVRAHPNSVYRKDLVATLQL